MFEDLEHYATLYNAAVLFGGIVSVRLAQLLQQHVKTVFSPLRKLPGPKVEHFIWGNLKQVMLSPNLIIYDQWAEKYGSTFAYQGLFLSYRLVTLDVRALNFILSEADSFPKPNNFRRGLAGFVGQGLLFVESEAHRRQRRIMNPSFGSPHIRALLPIFWQKSNKLKDAILDISKSDSERGATVNILPWISRATLDIIGAAGFDYHFNSLENDENDELSAAFRKAFQSGQSAGALDILQRFLPMFRYLFPDERARAQVEASAIMRRIGLKLVSEKKASLTHEVKTGSSAQCRDLLTLLIKSNMAAESEAQMMTDDEVLGQISTFLFAGHETTSTSTSWALYALARYPEVQHRLRQELLDSGFGDEPSMVDLDKLQYLDAVVHETLRLYPAVPATIREAAGEMHIPTSHLYTDRDNQEKDSIHIQKGDLIVVPIVAINRNKEIWGEDAMEFRPERWEALPEAAKLVPGVWGHLMTFIHGSRSCIGYRFAVAEMKCLLYTLVRAIEFNIEPGIELECKSLSARPLVVSRPEQGNQMPLLCKPVLAI
ncbi:cytochrome P450 family protein [Ceratobasidium sp. AG-Ba]|nr:cytochrome P450 family protein [Ceratobasidium sp. AG-Ba]